MYSFTRDAIGSKATVRLTGMETRTLGIEPEKPASSGILEKPGLTDDKLVAFVIDHEFVPPVEIPDTPAINLIPLDIEIAEKGNFNFELQTLQKPFPQLSLIN